jgi:hypothetical protein
VAVSVDTAKVYDTGGSESSYSAGLPVGVRGLQSMDNKMPIEWRDHESECLVRVAGIEVSDFKAHKHIVELRSYRVS